MKVLITAPSLQEHENVSGISTIISAIIAHATCEFVHFTAGRKDADNFDHTWLVNQIKLPFSYRSLIARSKPDVIHINTAFEPRAIIRDLVLASLSGKIPLVVHVHGGRFVMQNFTGSGLKWAAGRLMRFASRVIALSEAERDELLRLDGDLKVEVLPNAVATDEFPVVERERTPKTILYIGRLDESKGLNDMVDACRMLKAQGFAFRFNCCGSGPEREGFTAAMAEALGDDFHFGGVVAGAEKIRVLMGSDIFLMPSRFEGLPMALLEAMAAGCVPIVSNRGSIPSVVEDGRNGFLVEPGDLTQIVGRIKFLLSEGETGWEEYRRNARDTVRQRFDIGQYVAKLQAIYRDLAPEK